MHCYVLRMLKFIMADKFADKKEWMAAFFYDL